MTACSNILKPEILQVPNQILDKKDPAIVDLFHAIYSLKAMGKGTVYDKEEGLKNLVQLLKKDDVPLKWVSCFHHKNDQFSAHCIKALLSIFIPYKRFLDFIVSLCMAKGD